MHIPNHIVLFPDGNRRWAKKRGLSPFEGHLAGEKKFADFLIWCKNKGVKMITVYGFSTENWNRPKTEVNALMQLLVDTVEKEIPSLMKNGIRLKTLGNISQLPNKCIKQLNHTVEITKDNQGTTLVLALSYSGRWDLIEATKNIVNQYRNNDLRVENITEETITKALNTSEFPNPDLLIRTSGEMRISNFLLWEIAYSEIHFTDVLWPDFNKEDFLKAILDYQSRERRFGKTTEQLT
jgi:undecaprenyl diphosphate synthase